MLTSVTLAWPWNTSTTACCAASQASNTACDGESACKAMFHGIMAQTKPPDRMPSTPMIVVASSTSSLSKTSSAAKPCNCTETGNTPGTVNVITALADVMLGME